MPFCDAHGWRWEPGQGPSPCVGETISLFLACGVLLYTIPLTKDVLHPFQRAAAAGSTAARIHAVQVSLAIVQALIALTGGMLSARPRGMLCGALVLHSLAWPAAWFTSATAMQRSPDCSKGLLWFWCCALVLNSVVLSSLRHASEVSGRHLPAEIGCLSWMSFFGIALLVVLQLAKPELHDTEGVYVRVVGREGVVPSTAANDGGWQAFWAGGGDGFGATATVADIARRKKGWFCLGGRRGAEDGYEEGGAWPVSGGASRTTDRGTLNESLLGTIGFEERAAGAGASPAKAKGLWSGGSTQHVARSSGGCFQRAGGFLCSVVGRKNKATSSLSEATTATAAAQQEEGMVGARAGAGWLQRQDSPFERKLRKDGDTSAAGSGTRVRAQQPLGGGGGGGSSSSYSGGPSIGARAPPQVAAPVFSVAVTRWRLVSADGVPLAHGSSRDTPWTDHGTTHDRPRAMSSSSVRTAILSGAGDAIEDRPYDRFERSSPSAAAAAAAADLKSVREDDGAGAAGATHEPPRVQFELLVRASGRGEMDWWGHGDPEAAALPPGPAGLHSHGFGGAAGATASTPGSGDWRVWRSAADTLALYDALALRFGQEFCGRVARPEFVTVTIPPLASSGRRAAEGDGGSRSPTPSLGSPALALEPAAPHRVDILRDAKTVGAFLRSLLGLRQFLSTAVMDYLAQPPPAAPPAEGFSEDGLRDYSVQGNGGSENGSDSGYSTADDLLEEETGSRQGTEAQRKNASRRRQTFAPDAAGGGPSAAGEAVAVAALASDYGSWLKRLAVRLRRSTPAGERFVRLRCISPAVTGAQVVWWLVREEVCNGDRASAVRLGQDMVSHRLMTPLCAGYDRPRDIAAAAAAVGDRASGESRRDPSRSFDDAVGWLFAFAGDALRDPFAPPPPTQVAVMTNTGVDVRVTGWTETSDEDGTHVSFVVHTHVEATQEAWECPRRYREFTQLRKRLLRLGIDIPTVATRGRDAGRAGVGGGGGGGGAGGGVGGVVSPELPKKTWRANKFDSDHLETRRAALEAYLQAAVKAALAAPHLSGHLVMRFLDPDESNLRILTEQQQQQQQQQRSRNPFASSRTPSSPSPRGAPQGAGGGGARRRGGSIGGSGGVGEASGVAPRESVGKRLEEDRAEAEDFDTLTDSLGGFG